jgi:hypothetical protein
MTLLRYNVVLLKFFTILGLLIILGCYITPSNCFLNCNFNFLTKRTFLLNAAFSKTIVDLISLVHLASYVIMLHKYLKYSTFSVVF